MHNSLLKNISSFTCSLEGRTVATDTMYVVDEELSILLFFHILTPYLV